MFLRSLHSFFIGCDFSIWSNGYSILLACSLAPPRLSLLIYTPVLCRLLVLLCVVRQLFPSRPHRFLVSLCAVSPAFLSYPSLLAAVVCAPLCSAFPLRRSIFRPVVHCLPKCSFLPSRFLLCFASSRSAFLTPVQLPYPSLVALPCLSIFFAGYFVPNKKLSVWRIAKPEY